MLNVTELCGVFQTKDQLEAINYVTWHSYGISLAILFFVPLFFLIVISALNGSLGTKYWMQDFIIPYLIAIIILVMILTGILPSFTTV